LTGLQRNTMSELAPFVAATLRDKVVEELEKEARKLRLRDCDRTMLATFHDDYVMCYYIFEEGQFAPMVDVLVAVKYGPVLDWESRGLSLDMEDRDVRFNPTSLWESRGLSLDMEDRDVRFNPSSFQNKDIASIVFDHVAYVERDFPSDAEDDGDDEMNV